MTKYQIKCLYVSTFRRLTRPIRSLMHRLRLLGIFSRDLPRNSVKAIRFVRHVMKNEGWRGLRPAISERLARSMSVRRHSRRIVYSLDEKIGPLILPLSNEPEISIIIPTYGQHLLTYNCLKSISDHLPSAKIEILVLDDAAPEPAAEVLSEIRGVVFIRNDHNKGYLRNCNLGASNAHGKYLLLLNNDTILLPGSIDVLLKTLKNQPNAAAAGVKLVYPDGRLQEAGGIVWRDGSAWNWGRYEDPADPRYNYLREADYCSAACLLVDAALFKDLGGFDERFIPAYYEDTDLCFAIRQAGRSVLYQPEATVVHFEGASHGSNESEGLKVYQVKNQQVFREKWAVTLDNYFEHGTSLLLARDRGVSSRVLWIEACMLTPDQDSGSLRTWRLLGLLRDLRCKVTFAADNLDADQPYTHRLQQQGIEVLYTPHVRSIESYLRKDGAQYDAIVLCRHYIAVKYIDLIRRVSPNALLIYDTIDLHYLRLQRQWIIDKDPVIRRQAEVAYKEEIDIVAKSDITLVVSDVEAVELAKERPGARIEVLSNVHDVIDEVPGPSDRANLLFVGGFQHPPNIDAVRYFAEAMWPNFRERYPEAKCFIIGSRMPKSLKDFGESAGLEMLGFVEDLVPYLQSCRVSISPLRYGAGVKGKVNQALSYGLPVVATSLSVEGMNLRWGSDVMVADNPVVFVDAISALYSDDALWSLLSRNGLYSIEAQFSSEIARSKLIKLLQLRSGVVKIGR